MAMALLHVCSAQSQRPTVTRTPMSSNVAIPPGESVMVSMRACHLEANRHVLQARVRFNDSRLSDELFVLHEVEGANIGYEIAEFRFVAPNGVSCKQKIVTVINRPRSRQDVINIEFALLDRHGSMRPTLRNFYIRLIPETTATTESQTTENVETTATILPAESTSTQTTTTATSPTKIDAKVALSSAVPASIGTLATVTIVAIAIAIVAVVVLALRCRRRSPETVEQSTPPPDLELGRDISSDPG